MSKSTPWGPSQGEREAAPGIVFYHTAGHGGFHLSESRMMEFRQTFPWFETFAGGPWFEEDYDYSAVVLVFGDTVFNDEQIRGAVRSVKHFLTYGTKWINIQAWLENTSSGRLLMLIADRFDVEHAGMWEAGGGHGGGFDREYRQYWCQHFQRAGVHRSVMIPDGHPLMHSHWMTDEEIGQFEEFNPEKHNRKREAVAV